MQDSSSENARKLAAAALVEVKDAGAAASGRGKVEVSTLFCSAFWHSGGIGGLLQDSEACLHKIGFSLKWTL